MSRITARSCGVIVALIVAVTACGSSGRTDRVDAPNSLSGSITVSAASSLSAAFEKLSREFARRHPGTSVELNTGSSTALVTQIEQGAPADVFASADTANMIGLVDAKRTAGAPKVFARNRLAVVTKPGNPRHITTIADLVDGPVVALCAATVPCGKYARQIFSGVGLAMPESSVTREPDAQATVGAVANGDADAAIVYVTDARGAGAAVQMVAIPDAQNVIATYPAATLTGSKAPNVGRAFVAFLTSPPAQAVLASFGFLPPT
ncbi:MAG: molybdate ABC transporter substrate-binding protein [Acidimicrobiia bacterium]